ncbi:hypothetical protein [Chryseobacterium oncorhynchi]|uniref:Uncharacterized protein n=1 Tax=Chryseobacterium oncorhynchi TaxID=741074 RepID=A0A316X6V7_9FLAO|nr:hypothetical protein [Chryseobacterium oncorhynchi]PWN66520.1 hypothetical protein C1638_009210 [Chryseobacterium oncorhynchi]
MQLISHLLIIAILFNYSCTKTKIEQKSIENNNILPKTSLEDNNEHTFRLPDLDKLADKSPILKAEGFGNENEELRFIVGDIIILSADKKLVYLNLLPKTTEDNSYVIHLIVQNLEDNSSKIAKKWIIDLDNSDQNTLMDFYKKNKVEINKIFKNENLSFLNDKILFNSYNTIKDINLKYNYENDEVRGITVFNKNQKIVNIQKISGKTLCPECDSLRIYKGDYLGSISFKANTKKLLILGLLEQVSLSPSALHIRFVSL